MVDRSPPIRDEGPNLTPHEVLTRSSEADHGRQRENEKLIEDCQKDIAAFQGWAFAH